MRDHDRIRSWLERFGDAWETRDPDLAAALFSEEGSYRETPFDEGRRGRAEIHARWSTLPSAKQDIKFSYEILAVTEERCIAHWQGSYTEAEHDARVELDGILMISLDDEGLCRDFREWSNRREHRALGSSPP